MQFSEPYWFWALLFLPLWCLAVIWQARRRRVAWQMLVAQNLQHSLVKHGNSRLKRVVYVLLGLSYVCMVFALARPYTGRSLQQYMQLEQRVFFALDSSASMNVKDLGQSRLDYAKNFIYDFMQLNPQMQCGLISFSGDANLILPFTQDHGLLVQSLDQIRADSQSSGSDYNAVFELLDMLPQKTLSQPFALVLLSDGGQTQPFDMSLLKRFSQSQMRVVCVGIGSVQGALIPDAKAEDGLWRDARGASVVSRYNQASLMELSQYLHGDYLYAKQDSASQLAAILKEKLGNDQTFQRSSLVLHEVYSWFAIPALVLLLLALLLCQRLAGWKSAFYTALVSKSTAVGLWLSLLGLAPFAVLAPLQAAGIEQAEQLLAGRNYAASLKLCGELLKNPDISRQQKLQLSFLEGYSAQQLKQYDFALQSYSRAMMLSRDEQQIAQIKFNIAGTLAQAGLAIIADEQKLENPSMVKDFTLGDDQKLAKVKVLWQDALQYYQSVGSSDLQPASEVDSQNLRKALEALQLRQNPNPNPQGGAGQQQDKQPQGDNKKPDDAPQDNPSKPQQGQQSSDKQPSENKQPGQGEPEDEQSSSSPDRRQNSSGNDAGDEQNPSDGPQDGSQRPDKRQNSNQAQGSAQGNSAQGLQGELQTPAAERLQREEAQRILRNSMGLESGALFRTPKRSNNPRDPQH